MYRHIITKTLCSRARFYYIFPFDIKVWECLLYLVNFLCLAPEFSLKTFNYLEQSVGNLALGLWWQYDVMFNYPRRLILGKEPHSGLLKVFTIVVPCGSKWAVEINVCNWCCCYIIFICLAVSFTSSSAEDVRFDHWKVGSSTAAIQHTL